MTKREAFIEEVKSLLAHGYELSPDAQIFFLSLQNGNDKEKKRFTENGRLILRYMQENVSSTGNLFKAKDIGEGLGISSRTVSGAIRKLVTDAFVEKLDGSPITYSLTSAGTEINLDEGMTE